MAKFGDAAIAGYTIAIRIIIFALLPSWGMTMWLQLWLVKIWGQGSLSARSVLCG